eukprot:3197551-Rhodomonas_salina.1
MPQPVGQRTRPTPFPSLSGPNTLRGALRESKCNSPSIALVSLLLRASGLGVLLTCIAGAHGDDSTSGLEAGATRTRGGSRTRKRRRRSDTLRRTTVCSSSESTTLSGRSPPSPTSIW